MVPSSTTPRIIVAVMRKVLPWLSVVLKAPLLVVPGVPTMQWESQIFIRPGANHLGVQHLCVLDPLAPEWILPEP